MPTIPGHQYEQPTEAALVGALADVIGGDLARAVVDAVARKAGLSRPCGPDDLVRMTELLMEVGDLLRVTARSEKIRAVTYRALYAAVS
jgi:hypothetical protein